MQCKNCSDIHELVCQTCYNTSLHKLSQFEIQSDLIQNRMKMKQKLKSMDMKKIIAKFGIIEKQKQIQYIKERIKATKIKIQIQQKQSEKLKEIKNKLQQVLNVEQQQKLQEMQYLNSLTNINQKLKNNIIQLKKQKKKFVQQIMKVHKIDNEKFRIQKYFKFQSIQNKYILTLENGNNSIPVMKLSNEQVIKYHPLQINIGVDYKQEERSILDVIKLSAKLTVISHQLFLNQIQLPYSLSFHRNSLKIGNQQIIFNQQQQLNSEKLRTALNMLQSDIEYMSYAIGWQKKSVLILDQGFFNELEAKDFTMTGFEEGRKQQNYLKFLKVQDIQNCHDDYHMHTEPIPLEAITISRRININDEQFEILQ